MEVNEVTESYRGTKLGMLPIDWIIKKGAEITVKITKGASPKWQGFDYQESGILFVTSENVRDGYLQIEQPKYLPMEFNEKQKNSQLKKGDLLINIVGASIGRSCEYSHNEEANINQAVCLFRTKSIPDKEFIKYYLQSDSVVKRLLGSQTESARPNLSLTDIRNFDFILPSRDEEKKKIASILSTWDKAIELKEKLIEQKKEQKKGLMQKLLTGEVRLPGFEGKWEEIPFTEVFNKVNVKKYQIQTKDYLESGDYPIVDQGKSKVIAYSNQSDKLYKIPKEGVVVFGDHTREIKYIDFDFIVGADGTQIFEINENLDTKFYYYHLLIKRIPNTGYNRHFKFIKEMWFNLPSIEEQKAISRILYTLELDIAKNKEHVEQFKLQKKGLMQLLLTGKVRVKV